MSKRWTKQKAGKQRRKQRKLAGQAADASASGAGGALGGFRGFMKTVAGTGGKSKIRTPLEKAFDVVLWLAMAGLVLFLFRSRCT